VENESALTGKNKKKEEEVRPEDLEIGDHER
jgi:hypothetical protein